MYLTEEQAKFLSKLAGDSRSRSLSSLEKEALKRAIDQSENVEQLILVLATLLAK